MGYFDQAFGGGGGGGSASAFTSPGMNPQMMAALMAMQNRGTALNNSMAPPAGPPTLPNPQSGAPSSGPNVQTPPGMPQTDPLALMKMIQALDPQKLRMMFGGGMGGGASAAGMPGGAPWGIGANAGLGTLMGGGGGGY